MKDKHDCPGCSGKKCYTYYIDAETNALIDPSVGRCERLSKCSYHLTPKQYFASNGITPTDTWVPLPPEPVKEPSFIDQSVLRQTLTDNSRNNLVNFLRSIFDNDTVEDLISNYLIGTSKNGGTIFWQVDVEGLVHTGKIILYDPATGKRNKSIFPAATWVHIKMKLKDFNLKQCLFGEHLIRLNPTKPIAIVESEKTAIIASVYFPQFVWLACGGLEQLSAKKLSVVSGKHVVLYPDLKCLEKWEDKAQLFGFEVSKTLEEIATVEEKENGLDLADYLIRFKLTDFVAPVPAPAPSLPLPQPLPEKPIELPAIIDEPIKNTIIHEPLFDLTSLKPTPLHQEEPYYVSPGYVDFNKLTPAVEREQFKQPQWTIPSFDGLVIPKSLRLDAGSVIDDVQLCIDSHLAMVEANNGKRAYKPYLIRLQQIHSLIST